MTTIAILGALLGLLALRIPVAFALGGLGMILLMIGGFSDLMVPAGLHASTQSFVLLSVPMFLRFECGRTTPPPATNPPSPPAPPPSR